jgi:hypothetical protein
LRSCLLNGGRSWRARVPRHANGRAKTASSRNVQIVHTFWAIPADLDSMRCSTCPGSWSQSRPSLHLRSSASSADKRPLASTRPTPLPAKEADPQITQMNAELAPIVAGGLAYQGPRLTISGGLVSIRGSVDRFPAGGPSDRDYALSNRDCALSNRDCALSDREYAPSNRDCALSDREYALSNRDYALSDRECTSSIRDSAPSIRRSAALLRVSA